MPPGKNPNISLELAFKSLTEMMKDPLKSNLCALRINLAAYRIDEELEECTSFEGKLKIIKSHPEFLRSGIRFLTNPQPPDDHMVMMTHLMQCRCDMNTPRMRKLHKTHRSRPDGQTRISGSTLIFDAVSTLCNCIALNLAELTRNRFRSPTSKGRSGEKSWPQDPDDLLPYDLKDSLIGMEVWVACENLGCDMFMLAGSIAQFYAPFAKEIFQLYEYTFAFGRTVTHLKEAVEFYDRTRASDITRKHFFEHPVKTIFGFYNILSSCDTPNFNIMVAARGIWIAPTLSRLTSILQSFPTEWSGTRRFIAFMTSLASADIDRTTGHFVVKFERDTIMAEHSNNEADESQTAFHSMVSARTRLGCMNIQCTSGDTSIHAQLCSKCSLIRFCDKKCQKEAWNSSVLPHKRACKVMTSAKQALSAENWALIGSPDFTYTQFQRTCEEKSLDMETINAIWRTISALRIQKGIFQEDQRNESKSQEERLAMAARKAAANVQSEKLIASISGRETVTVFNRDQWVENTLAGSIL